MAKEFKDYDRLLSKHRGELKYSDVEAFDIDLSVSRWEHNYYQSWSMDFIRHCVYEASDHLDWQRFRVGLKGLSTKEKLARLQERWNAHKLDIHPYDGASSQMRERCRIDNYIGALVRGGQLNSNFRVVK